MQYAMQRLWHGAACLRNDNNQDDVSYTVQIVFDIHIYMVDVALIQQKNLVLGPEEHREALCRKPN